VPQPELLALSDAVADTPEALTANPMKAAWPAEQANAVPDPDPVATEVSVADDACPVPQLVLVELLQLTT